MGVEVDPTATARVNLTVLTSHLPSYRRTRPARFAAAVPGPGKTSPSSRCSAFSLHIVLLLTFHTVSGHSGPNIVYYLDASLAEINNLIIILEEKKR